MDGVRDFNIIEKREVRTSDAAKEAAVMTLKAIKTFVEFLIYVTEYAVSSVYRAVRSEKAAYYIGKYKKTVIGISAGFVIFAAIGLIGGMEAGLISLGIGTPVTVALFIAFKLLSSR